MPGIACAGVWLVDIVLTLDRWPAKSDLVHISSELAGPGGGAANVVLDLAAFDIGLPLHAVGLTGADAHAALLHDTCRAAGIDSRHLQMTPDAATAHTYVMNLSGDSRTFLYHPGANDLLAPEHVPVDALAQRGCRILYLGYLNLLARMDAILPDGRSGAAHLLAAARAAGMMTCVDLVSSDGPAFRATVEATATEIDYLFLNEIEAARATGVPRIEPQDRGALIAAGRRLLACGVRRAVILHSATCAIWLPRDGVPIHLPAESLAAHDIASPVGAGDAFCAGVILGLHEGWTPARALALGHRAAAAALRSPTATGGIPPLGTLLLQHPG
ncbi:carbohydrate kinase family protein [Plastorhodobacter daqingensis]|uniref:Carbohydrate kinase family protein n=1 Tax=Plastorhodobacter daqingensis TaxID=1387281 RepID=A0ABW2UIL3_9RHOB